RHRREAPTPCTPEGYDSTGGRWILGKAEILRGFWRIIAWAKRILSAFGNPKWTSGSGDLFGDWTSGDAGFRFRSNSSSTRERDTEGGGKASSCLPLRRMRSESSMCE
ncbi:unnamed protein product, partial [Musa acuminata subsp. burmannicoides]